jgi:hypothetical protein
VCIDGVVLKVDGGDSEEADALALVVRLLCVDVVPVGHLALSGVQDGSDAQVFQEAEAHGSASKKRKRNNIVIEINNMLLGYNKVVTDMTYLDCKCDISLYAV